MRPAILLGAALALGCRGAPPPPSPPSPPPPPPADLAAHRARVLGLVGELRCDDVEQCRSLPLGAKPCGGPWTYLVFSTATTDSLRLAAAAAEYTALDAENNRITGAVSDCAFVAPPRLTCSRGYCSSAAREPG